MESSFLVFDNFFDRPDKARETALSLTYPEPPPQVYYPGRNSKESMAWPGHEEMMSKIIGRPLVANGQSHGCARITLAKDKRRGRVHVDPGCTWAGIIFLTLDEHAQGGTDFFRNRRYGTDRAPLTDEEAQEFYGKPTPRDALIDILTVERGSDPDEWERIGTLPMKFNRLILFRPWFWHSSGDGFGDSLENGRLVLLLFFAPAPGATNARIVPPL
jgi:hypothetical protein